MKQVLRFILQVFDALPIYVLLFDRNGKVIIANQLFLDAVGINRDDITAMTLAELEPNCTGILEQMAELEEHGMCSFRGQLVDQKGHTVFLQQNLVYVADSEDDLIASVSYDIGELISEKEQRLHLEGELRKAKEREDSANSMKAEFIANMNHEIRTPMNAITGYAEMLSVSSLNERDMRFVQTIRKNSGTLLSILNDVMELAKLEAGKVKILKSTTNLQLVVDEVVDIFSDQLREKNIDFSYSIQSDMPHYFVLDVSHCRQILTNLLSNALKFTQHGKVALAVSGSQGNEGFYDLSFQITDTGIGITEREQKNIFDLFDQPGNTNDAQGGKRFGLTLCVRLARMMGGGITFSSAPGEGSNFIFTLPAKTEARLEKDAVTPSHKPQAKAGHQTPILLVVDDVPMISNLVKEVFYMSTLEIISAETAENGLELAQTKQPDLILMDLNLAGVDGREVTQQLRDDDRTAKIPVIAMTGRMLNETDYQPIFDGFLAKPFHLKELKRVVEEFIPMNTGSTASLPSHNEPKQNQEQDMEPIIAAWDDTLGDFLHQAVVSGSLDIALHLGELIYKRGEKLNVMELQNIGEQLKMYAEEPDILGVEQLLSVLKKMTGVKS